MCKEQINLIEREQKVIRETLELLQKFCENFEDDYIEVEPWSIFHVWQDSHPNPKAPDYSIFKAWQLFHWRPDPTCVQVVLNEKIQTLAAAFLMVHKKELSHRHVQFIERALENQPDLYEVQSFNNGVIHVHGLISGKSIQIYAPDLSREVKNGDFVLAHAVPVDSSLYLLVGRSQGIPRQAKNHVNDFRSFIERCNHQSSEDFSAVESDVFNLFYDLSKFRTS